MIPSRLHAELTAYVRAWARHRVVWGTSAGTTEGFWSAACVELGPYRLPPVPALRRITDPLPRAGGGAIWVEHETLMYRFPHAHPEYLQRGMRNERYLDAASWQNTALPLLRYAGARGCTVVLHLPPVFPTERLEAEEFVRRLGEFCDHLPRLCRYAVDLGTPRFFLPAYLVCLADRGVAHVVRDRDDGVPLAWQLETPWRCSPAAGLIRARVSGGEDVRDGIVAAVCRSVEQRLDVAVYLDPPGEGAQAVLRTALFLLGVLRRLDPLLADLSPLRQKAA